jgi:MFS family permease
MNKVNRAARFLGLKRSIVGLLGMVVLVGMGEKMAERFLPVYIIALGGSFLAVGFLNGLDNLLSALYSFPGGYISDRFGVKRALLFFNIMAMVGYLFVILIPTWYAVIIGSIFFLSWTAISLPATMSLVSKALPKSKRTMGVTMHSLFRRFPMALGPVIGGFCIVRWEMEKGMRIAFCGALFMTVVAMIMQQILIQDDKAEPKKAVRNPREMFEKMSPSLRNLLISDILIRFCEQIPYAFVVIWCMRNVSGIEFGYLTAIEMATAVLVYIPVAYLADRFGKKPFILITFCFFTMFPLIVMFCHTYWMFVGAFIIRGLKEFGEPARKAMIMDLAPEKQKAAMFGLYYLIRDVIVSLAAFGSGFLWKLNPTYNFMAAFAFGIAGTLWFAFHKYHIPEIEQS